MGRKKLYITEEDKMTAARKWRMDYYWRNQKKEQKRNLKNYHERKKPT